MIYPSSQRGGSNQQVTLPQARPSEGAQWPKHCTKGTRKTTVRKQNVGRNSKETKKVGERRSLRRLEWFEQRGVAPADC
jgi:hypothetical protein